MPDDDQSPETGALIDLQLDRPHSARMYDYYLGGKNNYEADRKATTEVEQIFPYAAFAARTNRAFMHRAIRFLAQQGIRQFLDIGTGIPTEPNLHQIAQQVTPQARVVYVDNDPLVLAHARALLVSSPEGRTAYLPADATSPEAILGSPSLRDTLDLTQPVALSLFMLLHFVPDERDPYGLVKTLLDALAPGSYLVLSHGTADFTPEDLSEAAVAVYRSSGIDMQVRSREEFARFFTGLDLIEPGVTTPHRWRPIGPQPPESIDSRVATYAAIARK
jgi:SAM-dependent methyltransferase